MVLTKSPSNQMPINLRTLFKDVPAVRLDRFIIVVPNSYKTTGEASPYFKLPILAQSRPRGSQFPLQHSLLFTEL